MKLEQSYPIIENCYLNNRLNIAYLYLRTTGLFALLAEFYEENDKSLAELKDDLITLNQTILHIFSRYGHDAQAEISELKAIRSLPPFSYFSEDMHKLSSFQTITNFLHLEEISGVVFQNIVFSGFIKNVLHYGRTLERISQEEVSRYDFMPNFLIWSNFIKKYESITENSPELGPKSGPIENTKKSFFKQIHRSENLFELQALIINDLSTFLRCKSFINTELTWSSTKEYDTNPNFWKEVNDFFAGNYFKHYFNLQEYDSIIKQGYDQFPLVLIGFPAEKLIDISKINITRISTDTSLNTLTEIA